MIKNINNINIYKYYNNNKKYDTNTKKRPSLPTVTLKSACLTGKD